MKILFIDIETAPSLAHVYSFWKTNISPSQVAKYGEVLSVAYQWGTEGAVAYVDRQTYQGYAAPHSEEKLLSYTLSLLDRADVVVGHNGKKFDVKKILGRAVVHGFPPPSPFKVVDTLLTAKKHFLFESNSLEALANILGVSEQKSDHGKFVGYKLWIECVQDNPEAWAENKEYNKQDVRVLVEVYKKMLPYISSHPNYNQHKEEGCCPKCGSYSYQKRGFYHSSVMAYQRYRCNECGGWFMDRLADKKALKPKFKNCT